MNKWNKILFSRLPSQSNSLTISKSGITFSAKFIKAYASTKSKQNWTLELSSGNDIIKMSMTIRSNKSGHAGKKKLGQFPTGLAVKYNGIEK